MLQGAGADGMSKVVNNFFAEYPSVSKRQTELKIAEIAVKEKREDDTRQVMCVNYKQLFYIEISTYLLSCLLFLKRCGTCDPNSSIF